MKVNCVRVLDQLAEAGRLRDVEGEKFIVVEMARGQVMDAAPSASKGDCREERPTLGFGELCDKEQKANG